MQRIMIFGDSAAGKSTFAPKLGTKLGLPVIHVDRVQTECGRRNYELIRERLHTIADQDKWIIEGNALRKEPDYRINRADLIIIFNDYPIRSLARHISRYWRFRSGKEHPAGGLTSRLRLGYFATMILIRFPKLKRHALALAHDLHKDIVIIRSLREAKKYLDLIT